MYSDSYPYADPRADMHSNYHDPFGPSNRPSGLPPPHYRGSDHHRGPPPPSSSRRAGMAPRGGPTSQPPSEGRGNRSGIYFKSYAEERAWLEERRRHRLSRPSLFDVTTCVSGVPTFNFFLPDTTNLTVRPMDDEDPRMIMEESGRFSSSINTSGAHPTRHARRLYVGFLPADITESQLHTFFHDAIRTCMPTKMHPHDNTEEDEDDDEDPILSVYINKERRFAFLELKSIELTTAVLALDGVDVLQKGKVKIKRPNDYDPTSSNIHSSASKSIELDVYKMGVIRPLVSESLYKIFVNGLPTPWTYEQVLELFSAFGKIKAFHLVKEHVQAISSKGCAFVEYVDGENITPVAILGLNGMDLGQGYILHAKRATIQDMVEDPFMSLMNESMKAAVASATTLTNTVAPIIATSSNSHSLISSIDLASSSSNGMYYGNSSSSNSTTAPPIMRVVDGIDIQALIDIACGSSTITHSMADLSSIIASIPSSAALIDSVPPLTTSLSNNMMNSRILVLHNMVTDEDLESDDNYYALMDEVREECEKYGPLLDMRIPRPSDGYNPSSIRKIYLVYSTIGDAVNAHKELSGRQFGSSTVETTFFKQQDYDQGNLF